VIVGDTVVHEARYPHAIDTVWRAITDPAAIAAWLMGNDFVAERGHRFHLDANPSFGVIDAEVVDIEPPTLLRCTWMLDGVPTVVTIQLREVDGETVLRVEHERAPLDAGFDDGWSEKLRNLDRVLTGALHPSQSQTSAEDGLYRHPDLPMPEA
jgi:uncharacterized protein YndB with AHSA1/START domain